MEKKPSSMLQLWNPSDGLLIRPVDTRNDRLPGNFLVLKIGGWVTDIVQALPPLHELDISLVWPNGLHPFGTTPSLGSGVLSLMFRHFMKDLDVPFY